MNCIRNGGQEGPLGAGEKEHLLRFIDQKSYNILKINKYMKIYYGMAILGWPQW